jgi:hypothetical protein
MYKIIGGDGREYGPATAEQVREWIAQGRANARTAARATDGAEWRALGEFAEFADALASRTSAAAPPRVSQAQAQPLAEQILARDYELKIGECFRRGWELTQKHFWLVVCASAVIVVLQLVANALPPGPLLGLAIVFPLWGGLDWLLLRLARGELAGLEDAFAGFRTSFIQLLAASVVCFALLFVGLLALVVPAIYLAVCYLPFTALLILDKKLEFWPAMELSRRVVTRHWWQVFGFVLLGCLACFAGLLALVVGVLIAIPFVHGATVHAYESIFCREERLPAPGPTPPAPAPEGTASDAAAPFDKASGLPDTA